MDNLDLFQCFAPYFSNSIWQHARVLLLDAILVPGRRIVTAVLRIMGLESERLFQNYHRVLNRATWSSLALSAVLLRMLVETFALRGPVICGLDDTSERSRGAKIKAKGIYRDPVRSSHGHFVKASGLRWLSLMLFYAKCKRGHKKLTDWGRQTVKHLSGWLPQRALVIVADSSFAAISWLFQLTQLPDQLCLIVRFRLEAALYKSAPARWPGQRGRGRKKGEQLPTLEQVAQNPKTRWKWLKVPDWYGSWSKGTQRGRRL